MLGEDKRWPADQKRLFAGASLSFSSRSKVMSEQITVRDYAMCPLNDGEFGVCQASGGTCNSDTAPLYIGVPESCPLKTQGGVDVRFEEMPPPPPAQNAQ